MALFKNQFANVVEWAEHDDSMIFYKFTNQEIKKGSKLIIRPGQDAIFLYNGKIEGIFEDDGEYDIASDIVPFLSTLKGFKFGFNSGMRAEVLFVNTKELEVKWGTKSPISIPTPELPGGMPIRANGTFYFKVNDYPNLIEKIAGVKSSYYVDDVRQRITSILDQLLMKWISKEGKDMFNLQANAFDIAKGIREDLDMEIYNDGMTITKFNIMSFNYPPEIQQMQAKAASHTMVGNMDKYTQMAMADSIGKGKSAGGNMGTDMASMMMGMKMAEKMIDSMSGDSNQGQQQPAAQEQPAQAQANSSGGGTGVLPKFCPECGTKTAEGQKFCGECGNKF